MITLRVAGRTGLAAVTAATLALGLASCKPDATTTAGGAAVPSGTPTAGGTASARPAANQGSGAGSGAAGNAGSTGCLAGNWVSTSAALDVDSGLASAKGGAGVKLAITPAGAMTVRFTGMKPISYTAATGGVVGSFTYAGTARGTIVMPVAAADGGTWKVKDGQYSSVTARVRITAPVAIDLGTINLADLAKAFGGSAKSADESKPFAAQRWSCTSSTLRLGSVVKASKGSVSVGWVMARV